MLNHTHQEGDKRVIRDKIGEVFAAGGAEQARRRFDKEVVYIFALGRWRDVCVWAVADSSCASAE